MNQRFRINNPDVTHESFDGEVLVINLRKGHYYSLRGSAIAIWNLLAGGCTGAEIVEHLASHERAREAEIQAAVADFIARLEQEEMVVPDPNRVPAAAGAPLPSTASAFSKPVFDRYEDMKELLQLDPIHEVGPSGWPQPQKAQEP